nr:immunoglobulin light chain junction region [Macaca mulatta]MOV96116.1 immunoglobulin light chain junction region [Macaca mulatta]MOV96661.1 immunoglobulin light chain junction region [Macaca mulatta]MOV97342.1 immunoglobulin light chain junction region [Macaca mulatta]MOV98456.1 immunoglobulin light chain junction region [Macaca mulatta]
DYYCQSYDSTLSAVLF